MVAHLQPRNLVAGKLGLRLQHIDEGRLTNLLAHPGQLQERRVAGELLHRDTNDRTGPQRIDVL